MEDYQKEWETWSKAFDMLVTAKVEQDNRSTFPSTTPLNDGELDLSGIIASLASKRDPVDGQDIEFLSGDFNIALTWHSLVSFNSKFDIGISVRTNCFQDWYNGLIRRITAPIENTQTTFSYCDRDTDRDVVRSVLNAITSSSKLTHARFVFPGFKYAKSVDWQVVFLCLTSARQDISMLQLHLKSSSLDMDTLEVLLVRKPGLETLVENFTARHVGHIWFHNRVKQFSAQGNKAPKLTLSITSGCLDNPKVHSVTEIMRSSDGGLELHILRCDEGWSSETLHKTLRSCEAQTLVLNNLSPQAVEDMLNTRLTSLYNHLLKNITSIKVLVDVDEDVEIQRKRIWNVFSFLRVSYLRISAYAFEPAKQIQHISILHRHGSALSSRTSMEPWKLLQELQPLVLLLPLQSFTLDEWELVRPKSIDSFATYLQPMFSGVYQCSKHLLQDPDEEYIVSVKMR